MSSCGTPYLKQLKIKNVNNIITGLNLRPDILETIDNEVWISLYVDPNGYQPISGESSNFANTGKGSFLAVKLQRKGFTAKIDYSESNIRVALSLIGKHCIKNNLLVEVLDFVSPEDEDFITGFTYRKGIFALPFSHNGTIGLGSPKFTPEGFSITFNEYINRWG